MSYAIVGFGEIGQALAHAFARKNIDVTVASRSMGQDPPTAVSQPSAGGISARKSVRWARNQALDWWR
jgi:8-hydroxy-5-deazaflavin:NADPH oxidoreductase